MFEIIFTTASILTSQHNKILLLIKKLKYKQDITKILYPKIVLCSASKNRDVVGTFSYYIKAEYPVCIIVESVYHISLFK